jgi:Nif-specific regulatory protein
MSSTESLSTEDRLRKERDFYRRLLELGEANEIRPLLRRALRLVVSITGAQNGYIELRDDPPEPGRRSRRWSRASGFSEAAIPEVRTKTSGGVIAEALATGESVRSNSATDDSRFSEMTSVMEFSIQAVLCVPVGKAPPVGVVYLEGREDGLVFTREDQRLAEEFARHLAPYAHRLIVRERQDSATDATRPARDKLEHDDGIVGCSKALASVLERVALVAPLPIDVLLTGPTGSGKTAVARVIAQNSAWAAGAFVELNCSAIPEGLAESELFGAEKGAHSTATHRIEGKISAAEGGTLFLDEVGDLPLAVQAKLLQFLQEKTYRPLGSNDLRHANLRIIAATNRDLKEMIEEGTFRADLYYRLHTLPIRVPPLAERKEDVRLLMRHFVEVFSGDPPEGLGLGLFNLAPSAVFAGEAAEWPGNVRELGHRMKTAVLLCHGDGDTIIRHRHLFPDRDIEAEEEQGPLSFQDATRQFQRQLLTDTLRETDWNKTETARLLDIARSSVHNLINAHGISRETDGD